MNSERKEIIAQLNKDKILLQNKIDSNVRTQTNEAIQNINNYYEE